MLYINIQFPLSLLIGEGIMLSPSCFSHVHKFNPFLPVFRHTLNLNPSRFSSLRNCSTSKIVWTSSFVCTVSFLILPLLSISITSIFHTNDFYLTFSLFKKSHTSLLYSMNLYTCTYVCMYEYIRLYTRIQSNTVQRFFQLHGI